MLLSHQLAMLAISSFVALQNPILPNKLTHMSKLTAVLQQGLRQRKIC
jgi:hypothetical protein